MFYNIVFSPTGSVQKVTDIISEELSENITTIDLTQADTDFSNYQLKEEDTAVIAIPVFAGRAPQIAIQRLTQIKSDKSKAIIICVYGNRAYEDALVELQDAADLAGFNIVAGIAAVSENSIGRVCGAGRPDELDKKELKDFALKIKERLSKTDNEMRVIAGKRPYRMLINAGVIPQTTNACTNCKKCSEICPTGAISKTSAEIIDKTKCISCMRCVAKCPENAKKLNKFTSMLISFVLKTFFSKRKKNELF